MLSRWHQNQHGDTIVEVLIVIVVLGSILASAYSIAVRSLQSTQAAQEHGFALKIAEGQIEKLKALGSTPGFDITTSNLGFCLGDDLTLTPMTKLNVPATTMASEQYTNYPATCVQDFNGKQPAAGVCSSTANCYYYAIRRPTPGSSNLLDQDNFTATVRWDGPSGTRQQVQLSYRVYK